MRTFFFVFFVWGLISTLLVAATSAHAESSPERAKAMSKLAFMRGVWRGPAEGQNRDGSHYKVTQTERMGPMLDGDIIVIEGRGYKSDGAIGFNAFGVVSWDAQASKYELRSYAQGYSGTFDLKPTVDGYVWEIPAGPGTILRYTATVTDRSWREIGEVVVSGKSPQKTFEMNLKRIGDTDWPSGNPVGPNDVK
jgi:hypothetical protein